MMMARVALRAHMGDPTWVLEPGEEERRRGKPLLQGVGGDLG